MSGKLLLQARKDVIKIASSGGFQEDILISTKDGSIELAVKGLSSGHHQQFDTEGNPVNAHSTHCTITEQSLIDGAYPYKKQSNGRIDLVHHKIMMKDNTQTERMYVINEQRPNTTTGLIVCILGRDE